MSSDEKKPCENCKIRRSVCSWPTESFEVDVKNDLNRTTFKGYAFGERGGVVLVLGTGTNTEISRSSVGARVRFPVQNGSRFLYGVESDAKIYLRQSAGGASGSLTFLRFSNDDQAAAWASAQGAAGAVVVTATDGYTSDQSRGAFTPAVAGTDYTNSSASVKAQVFVAPSANTLTLYIADTQAKAALLGAAGGGVPIAPGQSVKWQGDAWIAASAATETVFINPQVS